MTTLYAIAEEALKIEDILREAEGELTPEMEKRMDALLEGGNEKLDAATAVLRHLEAMASECEAEASRLVDRRKAIESDAANLKARMLCAVDALGGKVKTAKNTIWGQTSADATDYELAPDADLETLSREFPELVRTTYSLNKTVLNKSPALPSAIISTVRPGKRSLRIK